MGVKQTLCFIIAIVMMGTTLISHFALAAGTSVKSEAMKLHFVDNEFHLTVDLPTGKENHQPIGTLFKKITNSSFPAFVTGNEIVIHCCPEISGVT